MRKRPDGNFTYVFGRMSHFIPFDVEYILNKLNEIEQCVDDKYGGGNLVGGSPRVSGSKLNPDQMFKIVVDILENN